MQSLRCMQLDIRDWPKYMQATFWVFAGPREGEAVPWPETQVAPAAVMLTHVPAVLPTPLQD